MLKTSSCSPYIFNLLLDSRSLLSLQADKNGKRRRKAWASLMWTFPLPPGGRFPGVGKEEKRGTRPMILYLNVCVNIAGRWVGLQLFQLIVLGEVEACEAGNVRLISKQQLEHWWILPNSGLGYSFPLHFSWYWHATSFELPASLPHLCNPWQDHSPWSHLPSLVPNSGTSSPSRNHLPYFLATINLRK